MAEPRLGRGEPREIREVFEARLRFETLIADLSSEFVEVPRDELWATENWRRMFGFPAEARIDYGAVIQRIHPQDREAVDGAVQRALAKQADLVTEYRVVLPDGMERWIAARGRARLGSEGKPTKLLGVSVDITNRKRAELALKDRVRFEQLLSGLSAAFINQTPERIDDVIQGSLTRLLETLGNDRSSLAQFSDDTGRAVVTHSYAVSGVEPFPVGVAADDRLPWYVAAVRSGNALFLRRLPDDLPLEAEEERQVCLS